MMRLMYIIVFWSLSTIVHATSTSYNENNICIEYSNCLNKEDEAEVRKLVTELANKDRQNLKAFRKYLASNLVDVKGNFDKEVLFSFLEDYTRGRYDINNTSSMGAFSTSFSKKDNGCYEYVYRYTSPSREGEYSTWIIIDRDPSDGAIKIMQLGLAG